MNETATYDVAIIGGGLAGLCLAIQCADANYSVILFEKEEYPFHKVCGEYISNESRKFLERLGVPLSLYNLPEINKLQVSDMSGSIYNFTLPLGGFGISRFMLEDALFKIAVSKGVQIETNTKVQDVEYNDNVFSISTNDKVYSSKVAAGCFGKRSNLDVKWSRNFIKQKSAKLNNYVGIKYHINYSNPENVIALHNFKNGYCGISKIEGGKSCLCYLTTADNLKLCGNSISKMQEHILYKNPKLEKIFNEATFIYDQPLAISQISFSEKAQVENHVLMIGDSAGLITPLCGNGMSMAMHGSKLAFNAVKYFLDGNSRSEMERQYQYEWKENFKSRLLIGRVVQSLFGEKHTTAFFLKAMHAIPVLSRKLISSTHGVSF